VNSVWIGQHENVLFAAGSVGGDIGGTRGTHARQCTQQTIAVAAATLAVVTTATCFTRATIVVTRRVIIVTQFELNV